MKSNLYDLQMFFRAPSFPDPKRMAFGDSILRLLFLAQIGIGVLGNTFLVSTYASPFGTDHSRRPMHLIFTNMAVANFLVLLCRGFPNTLFLWGVTDILDSRGCKVIYYVHRVARGLSLCTTCLMSSFQAVTINSRTSRWKGLKDTFRKNTGSSCLLCWVSNLLMNIYIPMYLQPPQHIHNSTKIWNYGLCISKAYDPSDLVKTVILMIFPDTFFMGLMVATSVYMVILLHRHRRRVRHIHTTSISPKFSPEAKATQIILLLASTFILFYLINSLVNIYSLVYHSYLWLHHTSNLLAACYPTLSPLILMLRVPCAPRFCS